MVYKERGEGKKRKKWSEHFKFCELTPAKNWTYLFIFKNWLIFKYKLYWNDIGKWIECSRNES